ncbi:MAG: helicase-related protein [Campylobacterota bacterium]
MSKKKGKINKQVKKIFNGEGFDQGVAKLDEQTLLELLLFIGEKPESFDKPQMLRAVRSFWSQTNLNIRKAILNFISNKLQSNQEDDQLQQRIEKIASIAQSFAADESEIEALIESFKEHKSKKITEKKIKAKLQYLRFESLRKQLFDASGVWITQYDGSGEFYSSYRFDIDKQQFHKQLLYNFSGTQNFQNLDFQAQVAFLQDAQKKAQKTLQQQIQNLDQTIPSKHQYLSKNDIVLILKSMQVDDTLDAPTIDIKILRKVFDDYIVRVQNGVVSLQKPYECIFWESQIVYNITLEVDAKTLYSDLFYSQELQLQESFKQIHLQNLSLVKLEIDRVFDTMQKKAQNLNIDDATIQTYIKNYLLEDIQNRQKLEFRSKVSRKILYHFQEFLSAQKQRVHKEQLLKKTVRDFKNLFPVARGLKRKLIFHMGPTNSGKTYTAMQKLQKSNSGYYLAPLRLLALEGYEGLKAQGIHASLITGEEEIVDEESTHISSTIEMLNFGFDVDCCVIDEVQMLNDKDRGWAWVNAIIGAPAKEVYMTGSSNALHAIKEIASWLDEELEVVAFERKNPLRLLPKPIELDKIEPQTALIAFSRKDVLSLKQRLSSKYKISVVYGNLSPEVRREEARRFREGESEVLIATDAISMGLNLPIKTLLFTKDSKFDGEVVRELNANEVLQIAGRAGRYGIEEVGYVGGITAKIHSHIAKNMNRSLATIRSPFTVMANLEHVRLVAEILDTNTLFEILDFFANNMQFDGPFEAKKLDQMMQIARITDSYTLELEKKYHLSCAPVSINSPYIESKFHEYILHLEQNKAIRYSPIKNLPSHANSAAMLLKIEDRVKEISLYLWLSFKFPQLFIDVEKALQARATLNRFIENSLKFSQFIKRCKRCGRAMDFSFKFKVCDACFHRNRPRR